MGTRLRLDDEVVVISGREKGRRGRITKVLHEENRVLIADVNIVRRHTRPTPQNPEGGIIEKAAPIAASNVMLWDAEAEAPTRVRFQRNEDEKKQRISVKSGKVLEG